LPLQLFFLGCFLRSLLFFFTSVVGFHLGHSSLSSMQARSNPFILLISHWPQLGIRLPVQKASLWKAAHER
jgi:hypothetical protein